MREKTQKLGPEIVWQSPVLQKLDAMARDHVGGPLQILRCRNDQVERISIDGVSETLPAFCKLIRQTSGGAQRCGVCRWLMAIRACHRGATDYGCHGGVAVVAAPAVKPEKDGDEFVVVVSCGFGTPARDRGWKAAQVHAEGLPVDRKALKDAYYELPVLSDDKRALARSIVDAAATAIAEGMPANGARPETIEPTPGEEETTLQEVLHKAFVKARQSGADDATGQSSGSLLVDMVTAIVSRNPGLPFTVGNVARAAQVSPNHFSTLFRRHAGTTFSQYLLDLRISRAKQLLGDPRLTIYDVALQCGFQDATYFSRRFKAVTGKTPSEWRESGAA